MRARPRCYGAVEQGVDTTLETAVNELADFPDV
jgi:hypothetical protein